MVAKRRTRRSRKSRQAFLGKPNGTIQPRVEEVGPKHFGVVAVDCAKARAKWMFCNFYGQVLVEPTVVEVTNGHLQAMVLQLKQACRDNDIRDQIVAVEMTGTYHRPVQRAFRKAEFETRLVHPFASRHYRQPSHADIKTDDTDLEGIFRAAVNGFGLLEPPVDETYQHLQLLARHRRDLVEKRAKLQCQIREYLHRALPGYAALFPGDDLWTSAVAIPVIRQYETARAIREAGALVLGQTLREQGRRFQTRTIDKIVAWAGQAATPDPTASLLKRIWTDLDDDRLEKSRQIHAREGDLAKVLVRTPYVLLLTQPGINVTSAAELAGRAPPGGWSGPITHYAHAKAISGRAGLFPSRYQSDEVDVTGALARFRNHRLRAAWMRVADNLLKCNRYFRGKAELWRLKKVDPRDIRARIANRATRVVFQMVFGKKVFHHPSGVDRHYLIEKLTTYCRDHQMAPARIVQVVNQAADHLPPSSHEEEVTRLKSVLTRTRRSSRKQPESLGTLLVQVLAKRGIVPVESNESEAQDSD